MPSSLTKIDQASTPTLTVEAYQEAKGTTGQSRPEGECRTDAEIFEEGIREVFEGLKRVVRSFAPKTYEGYKKLTKLQRWIWDDYVDMKACLEPRTKHPNGKPKGTWELTLTYAPKWYQDDAEAQEAFKIAEKRLIKYYADELELYRSVGEFTRDGRAHLHILYRLGSGGKFTDKNLRRAYPHWNPKIKVGKGNQGGHHAICESTANYAGYIEKHLKDAWHSYEHNNAHVPTHPQTPGRILEGELSTEVDIPTLEEQPCSEVPCPES